jgi:hypothetical protein
MPLALYKQAHALVIPTTEQVDGLLVDSPMMTFRNRGEDNYVGPGFAQTGGYGRLRKSVFCSPTVRYHRLVGLLSALL